MIRNIIFDIGNVCVDFCYQKFFRSFGFPEEIVRRIEKATAENPVWDLGDGGMVTEEELLERFIEQDPEIEPQLRRVYENFDGIIHMRRETIPWIEELHRKGYQVYYLSNYPSKAERECAKDMEFISYMDGGILSYKERLIKPDPAIYKLMLTRFKLAAQECLFIDDKEDNCEAARKLSMHAIQYTTREEVLKKMAELGI